MRRLTYSLAVPDLLLIDGLMDHIKSKRGEIEEKIKSKKKTPDQINRDGFGAEIAFCRLTNLVPVSFQKPYFPIKTYDAILPSKPPLSIDVKQKDNPKYGILIESDKVKKPCDIYVSMIGGFDPEYLKKWTDGLRPRFTISGWTTKEEIFQSKNKTAKDSKLQGGWKLELNQLRDPEDLLFLINKIQLEVKS